MTDDELRQAIKDCRDKEKLAKEFFAVFVPFFKKNIKPK